MIRNNVQAAITAARMSVSLERFLLIEPVGKKEGDLWEGDFRQVKYKLQIWFSNGTN